MADGPRNRLGTKLKNLFAHSCMSYEQASKCLFTWWNDGASARGKG